MNFDSKKMITYDGLKLHQQAWTIPAAKADIAFVHGFFEHCNRYHNEAAYFNEAGYNFYSYDQRTHGQSEGKYRSYISDFNDYLKDYQQFVSQLKLGQERPYYLFAHSMGGLVMFSYLLAQAQHPALCKGAIFSAPLLMPDKETAPILQKISAIVGTLLPRARVLKIDATAISRDPEEIKKYLEDPLVSNEKMYAASGYQLIKQMKNIRSKFSELQLPFIILHGSDDKLAEIEGSKLLYNESQSTDKTFVPLENHKHEITRDLGKEKVLNTILNWMNDRL